MQYESDNNSKFETDQIIVRFYIPIEFKYERYIVNFFLES